MTLLTLEHVVFGLKYLSAGFAVAAVCCRLGCLPCEKKDPGSILATVLAWPLVFGAGVMLGTVVLLAQVFRKLTGLAGSLTKTLVHDE